tara:strand:+ start:5376 stop:5747 length:372 start_codon:yes stop_codon:yes gene_type:complete
MTHVAAILYLLMIGGVIVFQVCLMAGAPWGRITQGGRVEGALPLSGRVIAGVSILLLILMGAGVASAAGLTASWPGWTAVAVVAVQGLSAFLNWITPSRPERLLWGPVTTVMLALAVYVVFGG